MAHHAEGVADGEQSGLGVVDDGVEEPEERRLPGGVLGDPLALRRQAVVGVGVDVPRAAGAGVEGEAAARGLGDLSRAAHVEGERAHPHAGLLGDGEDLAGGVEQGVDDAVVAEVRPAVVHVEHGDVDDPRLGGREVLRPLHADVFKGAAGGVGGMVVAAKLMAARELVSAEKGHVFLRMQLWRPRGAPVRGWERFHVAAGERIGSGGERSTGGGEALRPIGRIRRIGRIKQAGRPC